MLQRGVDEKNLSLRKLLDMSMAQGRDNDRIVLRGTKL